MILNGWFTETGQSVSLSRTMLIIVFGLLIYFWLAAPITAVPDTIMHVFDALLIYAFAQKGVGQVVTPWLNNRSQPQAPVALPPQPQNDPPAPKINGDM